MSAAEVDALLDVRRGVHRRAARGQTLRRPYIDDAERPRPCQPRPSAVRTSRVGAGTVVGRARRRARPGCTGGRTPARGCGRRSAPTSSCRARAGHLLRHLPPFAPGHDGPDESLWWAYFAQGKRSVVAPPGSAGARRSWSPIGRRGDRRRRPGRRMRRPAHDRQVVVAVTPVRPHRATARTGRARSWSPGRRPASPTPSASPTARRCASATPGAVRRPRHVAVRGERGDARPARACAGRGRGQVVDISMQEGCLSLAPETGVPLFLDDGIHRTRPGNRRAVTRPWGLYPCADGYISFLIIQPAHWRAMAEWIAEATGMDAVLDEVFLDMRVRWEVSDFIDECTEELTRDRDQARPVRRGPAAGHPDHAGEHRRRPAQRSAPAPRRLLARRGPPDARRRVRPRQPVPRQPRLVALVRRPAPRRPPRPGARPTVLTGRATDGAARCVSPAAGAAGRPGAAVTSRSSPGSAGRRASPTHRSS